MKSYEVGLGVLKPSIRQNMHPLRQNENTLGNLNFVLLLNICLLNVGLESSRSDPVSEQPSLPVIFFEMLHSAAALKKNAAPQNMQNALSVSKNDGNLRHLAHLYQVYCIEKTEFVLEMSWGNAL